MLSTTDSRLTIKIAGLSSLIGAIMAIPISLFLFMITSSANTLPTANASSAQMPTAEADYAQYMHAYTQGFMANLANANGAVGGGEMCVDPASYGGEGGEALRSGTAVSPQVNVKGATYAPSKSSSYNPSDAYQKWMRSVTNNHYNTEDYSRTTTSYINSNNTVGSNNTATSSNETNVEVKDSKGVVVSTDNEAKAENETYYEGNTVISDSGNTTHEEKTEYEYKEETNFDDSFNTETEVDTEVETDIDVDEEEYTNIENSYNKLEAELGIELAENV